MSKKNVPEVLFARLRAQGDCLIYTGRIDKKGYGRISWAGRTVGTHRLAYELAYGPVPKGKYVLHSCDRPACCAPRHLRAGTNGDNMRDMWNRRPPKRKLSPEEVKQIRAVVGWNHRQLARLYGVGWRAIQKIVKLQRHHR